MVINIYIVKKICKTKVNSPRKMGKCYEYMIHRRANTNGQQTYERMLKSKCREMEMKVKMRYNFINIRIAKFERD